MLNISCLTCSFSDEMEVALNCRPSEPVYTVAILKAIYDNFSISQLICTSNQPGGWSGHCADVWTALCNVTYRIVQYRAIPCCTVLATTGFVDTFMYESLELQTKKF